MARLIACLSLACLAALAGRAQAQAQPASAFVDVTVVEKASGNPIEGAEVLVTRAEDLDGPRRFDLSLTSAERDAACEAVAATFRTGKEGAVRVPRTGASLRIAARTPAGLYGCDWVHSGASLRLALEPDESREVEVVDAAGVPASGARVVLVSLATGRRFWSATTRPPSGVAVIEHWPLIRQSILEALSGSPSWKDGLAVSVGLPLTAPPVEAIHENWRPTRVRLVLPPTKPFVVRLVDAAGRPVAARAVVRASSDAWLEGRRDVRISEAWQAIETTTGEARFARVTGPQRLEIEVTSPEGRFPRSSRTVDTEDEAWSSADPAVTVAVATPEATIVGRIVEAGDRPRVGKPVLFTLTHEHSYRDQAVLVTEADGRFAFPLRYDPTKDGLVLEACLDGRRKASVRLPASNVDGVIDVGAIRIESQASSAGGTVVDLAGKPLVGACVMIERSSSGKWDDWLRVCDAWTDDRGRFDVYDALGEAKWWALSVTRAGYAAQHHVPFMSGAQDLVVKMWRAATIRGRLTMPEGARIRVVARGQAARGPIRPASGHDWFDAASGMPVGEDGGFGWTGLLPGRLDLAVTIDGIEQKALAAAIDVVEGEDAAPPELNPIRLAEKCRTYEVKVVDAAGAPLDHALVIYSPRSPGHVWKDTDFMGRATVVAADPHPEIGAYRAAEDGRKGFRPKMVTAAERGEVRITLDDRIPLHVSINDDVNVPAGPLGFYVTVGPDGDKDPSVAWVPFFMNSEWIDGTTRETDVGLPFAGKYVLMVCVADRVDPTFRRFGAHKDAIRFEVIDGKPVQPIHVVLTQASVDAAAKEIEKYEVRSCDVPDSRKSESAPAK